MYVLVLYNTSKKNLKRVFRARCIYVKNVKLYIYVRLDVKNRLKSIGLKKNIKKNTKRFSIYFFKKTEHDFQKY